MYILRLLLKTALYKRVFLAVFMTALAFLTTALLTVTPAAYAHTTKAQSGGGASVFVQVADSSNSSADYTCIDNHVTNNNPNAAVFVTANWNPNGEGGVYDDHPIGVYYNSDAGQWCIFNQDYASIPDGASFNVYALPEADGGANYEGVYIHTATASNTHGNYTDTDNAYTNGQPNTMLLVTPNWNPGATGGTYNDHPTGVWYHNNVWSVFNQDMADMPVNASFNIMYNTSDVSGTMVQTADASNSSDDYTVIDNASANDNPNALVFVTPNWNPSGSGGVYDNHNIGVFYNADLGRWCVFNQDGSAIPDGAAFNVLITSVYN